MAVDELDAENLSLGERDRDGDLEVGCLRRVVVDLGNLLDLEQDN